MLLVSSFTKYKNDSLKAGSRAGHSVHWLAGPMGHQDCAVEDAMQGERDRVGQS